MIAQGVMYSGAHDGVASGYLSTTNINPTVGVRYRFLRSLWFFTVDAAPVYVYTEK